MRQLLELLVKSLLTQSLIDLNQAESGMFPWLNNLAFKILFQLQVVDFLAYVENSISGKIGEYTHLKFQQDGLAGWKV